MTITTTAIRSELLQIAADTIDAMLHTCCEGKDISRINAAWERGERVLVELRTELAAQPLEPVQAGKYLELPECKYTESGDIKDFGLYNANKMQAYADAICTARERERERDLAALRHPAVKADMRVNSGALRLALNVLRRAGKTEVADELESSAQAV